MLFNSYEFIFAFLPTLFVTYYLLLNFNLIIAAKVALVLGSLFFYAWWNVAYLPILVGSMVVNYIVGSFLHLNCNKLVLIFGVTANLALLGYFKYAEFLLENINYLLGVEISILKLTLPLAISFFTFQQITYLIDSYYKKTTEYNFLNYSLFVTFFPQLIAGPIVHHSEMMPQFSEKRNFKFTYQNISLGLFIFSLGLFKKVIIADTFSVWAIKGFDEANVLNLVDAWITSLSYTFQLYFDFSGYADMAIGSALFFNINLPSNFNSPYKSSNIRDFWRKWHMTLSRFLRDYVYIPLGGNRKGELRAYSNILLTFLIGGLWHGAGWTFIFWGGLHGVALSIHRLWRKLGLALPVIVSWFVTFMFVNIAWIFFRALEWDDAMKVLLGIFGMNGAENTNLLEGGEYIKALIFIIVAFVIVLFTPNLMEKRISFKAKVTDLLFAVVAFLVAIYYLHQPSEFLYFNF